MPNYNQCRVSSGSMRTGLHSAARRVLARRLSATAVVSPDMSGAHWHMCPCGQRPHGRCGTHIVKTNPQLADKIVAAVTELGPSTAGRFQAHLSAEPRGPWGAWWIG
jgi:hypothetical protein